MRFNAGEITAVVASKIRLSAIVAALQLKGGISVGGTVRMHPEIYDGATTVTPSADTPIVLETAEKTVMDDITVRKIPFYEVSSPSGGSTIYIGMEVL